MPFLPPQKGEEMTKYKVAFVHKWHTMTKKLLTTNHRARLDTHNMAMDRKSIGKQKASDLSSRVAAVPFSSPMMISAKPGDWTKGTKP